MGSDVVTLEELSATPTGKRIIRERNAKVQAEADEVEAARQRDLAAVEAEFTALAPEVLAGRERTLAAARDFVDAQRDLNVKYQSLMRLKHRIRMLGGTYELPERLTAKRAVVLFLRELVAAGETVGQTL